MTDHVPEPEPAGHIPEECSAVVRHLWDLLDDQLSDVQAERLRQHISSCEICYRYLLYQETFLEAFAAYRARFGVPSRVRAKVRESLREAGFVESR